MTQLLPNTSCLQKSFFLVAVTFGGSSRADPCKQNLLPYYAAWIRVITLASWACSTFRVSNSETLFSRFHDFMYSTRCFEPWVSLSWHCCRTEPVVFPFPSFFTVRRRSSGSPDMFHFWYKHHLPAAAASYCSCSGKWLPSDIWLLLVIVLLLDPVFSTDTADTI